MAIHLHLFGRPLVDTGGEKLALPSERRHQVLVFLALKRAWVGRAELAAMLWPELNSKLAHSNLRKTLFRLQSLPWDAGLEVQGNALRIQAGTDVRDFENALGEGRIGDALRLRTGELLEGFDDDNEAWAGWLGFERERLRTAWRRAALEHLGAAIPPSAAVELSARLLEADPVDEAALRAHMQALARSGQAAGARRAYREFAQRLQQDFGLAPGAELKALHDSLGMLPAAAAAPTGGAPVPADHGFVGRATELRWISDKLARAECRLLCLVGPGGVGKTRLAQRALQESGARYPDGAVFIGLDEVAAAGEVAGRLARELGLARPGGKDPLQQVVEYLRERRMLLVLDNFEHVLPAAAALEQLLERCPGVQLVVTSRVRLGLAAEWPLPLEGLPYPDLEDQDRLEAFDAVRVFVNAAQRVEPAFLAAAEGPSIIDICHQVGGLPLALELAAAWTRVLSCDAIAAELRNGTELLRAVDPKQPARHASIEVVFDHSWRLLTPAERDALARLSVFRGGFTPEAARAVAEASLPVLGALMDKSLLRKDGPRVFLHPVIHQLAGARLADAQARARAEAAHAHYFHRMLAQLRSGTVAAELPALAQVDEEFENCRAAWHWAVLRGQPRMLAQSLGTLRDFCDHRGRAEQGLALIGAVLDARLAGADENFEPALLSAVAHLQYRLDRYAEAAEAAERVLAMSQPSSTHDLQMQSHTTLGAVALRQGKYDQARDHFKKALRQASAGTHPRVLAGMLDHLALVERATGRWDEAQRMSLLALEQFRRLGDAAGEALCLNNLGVLHMGQDQFEPALLHLEAGLDVAERHGLVSTRGLLVANLAAVTLQLGDLAAAAKYAGRALEAAELSANRNAECLVRLQMARIALKGGDLAGARAQLRSSIELGIAIERPLFQLAGVVCFAEVLAAQGALDCARAVLEFVAAHPGSKQLQGEIDSLRDEWRNDAPPPAWAPSDLAELVHRITVETPLAHAPLIASIRGVN